MDLPERALLPYRQVRERQRTHPIRLAEVPVESALSLPMPTLRWGVPAYAQFAAPAVRLPEKPSEQGPPDRWWAVDARSGHLLVYARTQAIPFAPDRAFETVTLPPTGHSLDAMREILAELDTSMEAVAPEFFAGRPGAADLRSRAAERLRSAIPAPVFPRYRALAPDFVSWLEA
jgi:hypothetical protein